MIGIISRIITATRAFSGRIGLFLAMATAKRSRKADAEKIIAETLAKIEELQRRQDRVIALLREVAARTKGLKDVRAQIDKI